MSVYGSGSQAPFLMRRGTEHFESLSNCFIPQEIGVGCGHGLAGTCFHVFTCFDSERFILRARRVSRMLGIDWNGSSCQFPQA